MNSPAADKLLHAVQRRLKLRHVEDSVRFAAWTTVAAALIAVSLHLLIRPVSLGGVGLSIAVVWGLALLQAAMTPVRRSECAAWADRFLAGNTGYATYLECAAATADRGSPAAHERLVAWIEEAAHRSLDSLRAMPHDAGLRKPVALALIAALLASVLLQLPTRGNAITGSRSTSGTTASAQPAATSLELRNAGAAAPDAATAGASGRARSDSPQPRGEGRAAATVAADARGAAEERVTAPESQAAATRAASGGRDAGDSPDVAEDTGLSEAWQGAMAAKMRSLSEPPQLATRTDSTLAAEIAPAARAGRDADAASIPAPRPAVPPAAHQSVKLGPAEQAYVRAYFAGPGATP